MYDALTLAAIVDELSDVILDGRVQRVLLLDPLTVGLEVYTGGARHQLLLSASAREARLHLVRGDGQGRLTGDAAKVTPLLLLLRKYVRGARLVRVYQDPPLERVAFLRFARFVPAATDARDDEAALTGADLEAASQPPEDDDEPVEGELIETTLAVEIMGRHSNLILIGADGRILDSAKRVPPTLSRVRPVLPRGTYVAVPPQEKADPRLIDVRGLAALLAVEPDAPLQTVLVGALRGLSPQVAREAAFRATGSARAKAGEARGREDAVRRALDELYAPLRTGAWAPCLYRRDEGREDGQAERGEAVAFSPYPLFHLRALTEEREDSISAIAERFFGATGRVQAHAQRKEALAAQIRQERERVAARERSLEGEAARAEEAARWRRWGETIYAYAWSLVPGQRELVADGVTVPLDPDRSASENAQEYFERYRKAQSAAANLPALLDEARVAGRYLDQLLTLLDLATGYEEIMALEREWRGARGAGRGGDPSPRSGQAARREARPKALRARGGHQIFIGHTGGQNDAVTFDIAGPEDLWLHSRGVPGAHVIVKWAGDRPDDAVLQAAAELAAHYSANRTAGRVEVDYTARRDVRKIKGAGPGMVTYRNERTLRVVPCGEDELRRKGLLD